MTSISITGYTNPVPFNPFDSPIDFLLSGYAVMVFLFIVFPIVMELSYPTIKRLFLN